MDQDAYCVSTSHHHKTDKTQELKFIGRAEDSK